MNRRIFYAIVGCLLWGISACSSFQQENAVVIQAENVAKLEPILTFPGSAVATSLAFHPTEPIIATGWEDGSVRLIDFEKQSTEVWVETNSVQPAQVIFSPDGSQLVTGSGNGVILWDFATREMKSLMTESLYVLSLSFDATGERLAAVGSGKTWVWDLQAGSIQLNCTCNDEFFFFNPGGEGWGVSGSYFDLAWHDDSNLKWQASLWNAQPAGDVIDGQIEAAAFSSDGRLLAVSFVYEGIRIWETHTQVEHSPLLFDPALAITSLAIHANNQLLAASVLSGSIELWDLQKSEHLLSLGGISLPRAVAFSPDGQLLAVGSENEITLWAVR